MKSSAHGTSLTVPMGWRGGLNRDYESFVLEKTSGGAIIFVRAESKDRQTLLYEMSRPVNIDARTTLIPLGRPVERSGVISGRYSVPQAPGVRAEARIVLGRHGINLVCVRLGSVENEPGRTLSTLVSTVKITAPGGSAGGSQGGKWSEYMRGRYVARYYTRSGYTEEEHLWLCSNGSFRYKSTSGGFGGGASGAFGTGADGQWQVVDDASGNGLLTLIGNSRQFSYKLSIQGKNLYLNNSKWLRDRNEYCR